MKSGISQTEYKTAADFYVELKLLQRKIEFESIVMAEDNIKETMRIRFGDKLVCHASVTPIQVFDKTF